MSVQITSTETGQTEVFDSLNEWIQTRPTCIQDLAGEFPMGTEFEMEGERMYLIGWTESDGLIVSPVNPHESYDESIAQKIYVCAEHFRPQ